MFELNQSQISKKVIKGKKIDQNVSINCAWIKINKKKQKKKKFFKDYLELDDTDF